MVACAPIACKHRVSGSISLPSRGSFHLSLTVLCTIGHQGVFSLGGWSPLLPTRFHVSRGTLVQRGGSSFTCTGLSPSTVRLSRPLPSPGVPPRALSTTPASVNAGLGSFRFARRYSGNRCFFLFLGVLRCFNSPRSPPEAMCSLQDAPSAWRGFPHSDICGSMLICSSPQLFAAYHVLHRLLMPRHPPYALLSLI
jgi:hypothetical protein